MPRPSDPLDITSRTNATVKALVRLRRPAQARASGTFLAEGRREVERAAAAGLRIRIVVGGSEALGELRARFPAGVCRTASDEVMHKLLAFHEAGSRDAVVA